MDFILKPRDYFAACVIYIGVPFYSFRNLLSKDVIVLKSDEILYFEFEPDSKKPSRLIYSRPDFEGSIVLNNNFCEFICDDYQKKIHKRTGFELLREIAGPLFSRYSPLLWWYPLQVLLGYLLIEIGLKFNFGFNNLKNSFPGCNQECILKAHQVVLSTYGTFFIAVLPLFISLFFHFYYKKIKNADLASSVRFCSLIMLFSGTIETAKVINTLQDESTISAFQIAYAPEQIKKNHRNIASEFEKNKNFKQVFEKKPEKPVLHNKL